MGISMAIGLYTSRVILATLGAEDYGINNIVGGFVSMLSLFTVSLGNATSRFITYELGTGNKEKLKDTFSTISTLIIILSLIVFFLGETAGVWLCKRYMIIPADRWNVAIYCFHCSIITFIVNLLALPYQSVISAHEHFNFYAIVEIGNALFKLVIAWTIMYSPFDKLGTYATLIAAVSIIIRIIYSIYSSKYFEETKSQFKVNKTIFKEIAVYSGWVTIGASSAILKEQGVNVFINIFFGVIMNAARGISMQVLGIVNQFANNIATAIQPQITKSYASGNLQRSINLTFVLAKAKGIMIIFIALPIAIEADCILHLWLGEIPDNTVIFVVWALITCYARALEDTHGPLFLAIGKIRNLQLVGGGIMLLNLPLSYLFLKLGYPAIVTMKIGVCIEFFVMLIAYMFLKYLVQFPVMRFYKEAILPQIVIIIIAYIPSIYINNKLPEPSFIRLLINASICCSLTVVGTYIILLNKKERLMLTNLVRSKLRK